MRTLSIKIPNVSESLEQKLEAMILGGAFWPDMPIASERRLADEFDVSRTSLRNALASLLERGLLRQVGKRYHTTNVMADLLDPGLVKVAEDFPTQLFDYWIFLFDEAVKLAVRKAQDGDREMIEIAVTNLRQSLLESHAADMFSHFEALNRAVFDGCYNFFLSQTHQALISVMQPHFLKSFGKLAEDPKAAKRFSQAIGLIFKKEFERDPIYTVLATGFQQGKAKPTTVSLDLGSVDASQLVDVVLRNPLFLEAIYGLRLITERYAAIEAARHVGSSQIKQLVAHLDYMTAIADSSPAQYSKLDTDLHQLLAECTQNSVFAVINTALSPVFSRTTNQWLNKHLEMRSDQSTIHLQHTQIVEAVVARDPEKAQITMDEHLAYVLRNLRYLRQQDQLQEIAIARQLLR